MIRVGVRVRVPLRSGGRIANAWVIEVVTESAFVGKLSELDDVVSAVPVLTREVWRLVRAAADRAAGNASDILRLAIPTRYVRAEKAWVAAETGSLTAAQPGADAGRSVPFAAVDSARSLDGGVSTGTSGGIPAVVIAGYEPGRVERGIDSGERLALTPPPQPPRPPPHGPDPCPREAGWRRGRAPSPTRRRTPWLRVNRASSLFPTIGTRSNSNTPSPPSSTPELSTRTVFCALTLVSRVALGSATTSAPPPAERTSSSETGR